MMMLRPVSEMKDSGVEWIGQIPVDWKRTKISRCFGIIGSGTTPKSNDDSYYNGDISWLQSGDINGGIVNETKRHITEEAFQQFSSLKMYSAPFIAIAMYGASIANTSIVNIDACTNQACCVLSSTENITDFKYVFFVLQAAKSELLLLGRGGTQPNISQEIIKNFCIPIPPLGKQRAIADYLDDRCSKIDEIIAEATASIEEYKELKQAVIFEAVTKGLDKNVLMKDSGYDFIGDIPANWEMCKVRHIGSPQNGISFGGDAYGEGYPFVSYGDVYRNFSLPKQVKGLIQSSDADRERYSVKKGDIFFTRTSETKEEIGFSSVCEETILNAVFAGFLIRVRPFNDKLDTGFAKYYFRSNHLRAYFVKEMNLVIRASLGQELLKGAPVLLPPKEEQQMIADFLDKNCALIDSTINEKESVISDLQAYKKSLIYEVVTGKRRIS